MLQPLKYLWKTISQQVADEVTIIQDIVNYYRTDFTDRLNTHERMRAIKLIMGKALHYQQWRTVAQHYDQLPMVEQQTNEVYSPYYDYQYLQELVRCMIEARQEDDPLKLIQIIRSHSDRNVANINCSYLYRHAYTHSKALIEQYQQELARDFAFIIKADIPQNKKLQFFGEVRHAVGRSALLLSGGGIMGMYHIGVVQALIEADCLPKIIAGSSAGSIIASVLATHTREQLLVSETYNFSAFQNQRKVGLLGQLRKMGREGVAFDIKVLQKFLRDNIGEYTFQEAYDRFGVILNITVTGVSQYDPDRLLNYLTSPNVLIWSASVASCAIPYIYGPTELFCKDHAGKISKYTLMNRMFLDGSIGQDLPMNKLSILFNVNNFIVSQTNPWVIPFMDYTEDLKGLNNPLLFPLVLLMHRVKEFVLSELKHRASQVAYVFPNQVTKFLNLLTQSYVGDITIWPQPRFSDYMRILENPTSYEEISNFVQGGRQRTYPKIHHIKSTMYMEREIEKCYRLIRNNSRLHFLHSVREVQDAGEEEFIVKRVFQTGRQWQEDEAQSSKQWEQDEGNRDWELGDGEGSRQLDRASTRPMRASGRDPLRRNDSYLLPRERSFL